MLYCLTQTYENMKIAQKYSHLNGEEYLIVHYAGLYGEIQEVIASINIDPVSIFEKNGKYQYNIAGLNAAFRRELRLRNWVESAYSYYLTLNREMLQSTVGMPLKEQKKTLVAAGEPEPLLRHTQTDFVKDKIAVEIQFGKYAFVAYDLFVKHMLFYSGGVINLGIEVLPTKKMQAQMSSGIAYYEGEVYNVMRQGRNNPPVPLLILGIEP